MAEPCRTLSGSSVPASNAAYKMVGTPYLEPIRMIYLQNLTDQPVMFSLDGINDHFPLISDAYLLFDITANKTLTQGFYLPQGGALYAKALGTTPQTGSIYYTVFYGGGTT